MEISDIQAAVDAEDIPVTLERNGDFFKFTHKTDGIDGVFDVHVLTPDELPLEKWLQAAADAERVMTDETWNETGGVRF